MSDKTNTKKNILFFFDQSIGYLAPFVLNTPHKHYPIQLMLAIDCSFNLISPGYNRNNIQTCLINTGIEHHFIAKGNYLNLLINPISKFGYFLSSFLNQDNVIFIETEWEKSIKKLASDLLEGKINEEDFLIKTNLLLNLTAEITTKNWKETDSRIISALDYLQINCSRIISVEEVADYVYLSNDRFLHLFKQETGVTFRRMQLWHKLYRAVTYLNSCTNLTEMAHHAGFSDAAHFSRVFKDTFGIPPSTVLKNSRIIQV